MKKTLFAMMAMAVALSAQSAQTLADKAVMTIGSDTTWQGTDGLSPINVANGARAVINIKSGATLTVRGQDASGTAAATAAIFVPPDSTLYIVGNGTLIAQGGAAANGENGSRGKDG